MSKHITTGVLIAVFTLTAVAFAPTAAQAQSQQNENAQVQEMRMQMVQLLEQMIERLQDQIEEAKERSSEGIQVQHPNGDKEKKEEAPITLTASDDRVKVGDTVQFEIGYSSKVDTLKLVNICSDGLTIRAKVSDCHDNVLKYPADQLENDGGTNNWPVTMRRLVDNKEGSFKLRVTGYADDNSSNGITSKELKVSVYGGDETTPGDISVSIQHPSDVEPTTTGRQETVSWTHTGDAYTLLDIYAVSEEHDQRIQIGDDITAGAGRSGHQFTVTEKWQWEDSRRDQPFRIVIEDQDGNVLDKSSGIFDLRFKG